MPKQITIPEQTSIRLADRKGKPIVTGANPQVRMRFAEPCKCTNFPPRDTPPPANEREARERASATCPECEGVGMVPASITFVDFCEQVAEDPKFIKAGIRGVRAAVSLARCGLDKSSGEIVTLSDTDHGMIIDALNNPTEGFALPQGVARLTLSFYEVFENARNAP